MIENRMEMNPTQHPHIPTLSEYIEQWERTEITPGNALAHMRHCATLLRMTKMLAESFPQLKETEKPASLNAINGQLMEAAIKLNKVCNFAIQDESLARVTYKELLEAYNSLWPLFHTDADRADGVRLDMGDKGHVIIFRNVCAIGATLRNLQDHYKTLKGVELAAPPSPSPAAVEKPAPAAGEGGQSPNQSPTQSKMEYKKILTLDEAALLLGITKPYLYRLTSRHLIPHYKPGGKKVYFDRAELIAWVAFVRFDKRFDD